MKVPKSMLDKYHAIAPLITGFCEEYLNDEYAALSLLMLEKLCRKRPSPLLSGKPNTWACGIVYAVGSNNFLFDKSETPHMRAYDLAEKFGLSQSTAGNKARDINRMLNIRVLEPEWTLPGRIEYNPKIWMFQTKDGLIFDARYAPLEVQEELHDAGMIPFIPAYRKKVEENSILSEKEDAPKKKRERSPVEGQFSFFDEKPVSGADDTKPAAKPLKPIIHISEAKSAEPLDQIGDYCGKNQDFMRILKIFSDGYIPAYNKRKVALRNEVKIYMNRNFNTWYYSEVNPVFGISPARFINSDVYCKYGAGAVVFPVCKPVFNKSKIADITYSFHVFTLDDHPFIRDMRLFLETTRGIGTGPAKGKTFDSSFTYVLSFFTSITESAEFTFNERPYIIALSDACERLSLISYAGARGGIAYNEDEIDAFFLMPGREKLGRVIDILVERFVECIDDLGISGKKPDAEDVSRALQKEHSIESFIESLFGGILNSLISDVESISVEGNDLLDITESLNEEKAKSAFETYSVISTCCSQFFDVFGQYLQMILPEHNNTFVFSLSDDDYLEALEHEEENSDDTLFRVHAGSMVYHLPPGGYGLTTLGAGWFGIDLPGQDDGSYPPVLPDYYQEILYGMLEADVARAVDGFMQKLLSDPEQADSLLSAFESFFDSDGPAAQTHLETGPLDGLNPAGLPTFSDESAVYKFRIGRRVIHMDGTDTLSDLSRAIQMEFDLDEERLSSFYMGEKYFEPSREIACPRMDILAGDDAAESDNYMICQLNLYMKQKFLYLNDFRRENRFTVTFVGVV